MFCIGNWSECFSDSLKYILSDFNVCLGGEQGGVS